MSTYPPPTPAGIVQGQVVYDDNAGYGFPVNNTASPNGVNYNNNYDNNNSPQEQPQYPSAWQYNMNGVPGNNNNNNGLPNNVVIVHVAAPANGNQYYGGNGNGGGGGQMIMMMPGTNLAPAEQQLVGDVIVNSHWLKIYFVVAVILIGFNAFFSGLWFILAAAVLAIVAYVGVRLYNYNVMIAGTLWWIAVYALRILSVVSIYTWESGDIIYKIINTAAVGVGLCVDTYFCYKYYGIVMPSLKQMNEAQLAEVRSYPSTSCGCL